ncbi:flagellar export chaperone FliS [Burkholderia sp. Ac-20379]|uniref:flagellar export chaperone FliS n=1 Tax=Burkholderia sp. Ac-20379 TaxID=2703900 RepID=UPI00197D6183|nr:flagellar export chaperone FliS [Burkholderia sp. Ac-20379]MBN3728604.1 flagellar export chaperone FliS [Burkholderia sp. Ac-20379]
MTSATGYGGYHTADLDARTASASPVQLVIVLMDGLLDEMARVRGHIEGRRFEEKGVGIGKCIGILNGLTSALDFDSGSDVVRDLARLYEFCSWRLNEAGLTLNTALVDEVSVLVATLRDAWVGVDRHYG